MMQRKYSTLQGARTTSPDVVRWARALTQLHARLAPHFARREPCHRALLYLQGILSETERKNGGPLAEHAGEATPYGMQRLLSQAVWDADRVRDELRTYVLEQLGQEAAIVVIDETSFPKRGKKSAGVALQYCGRTGQVENCQVGVAYASPRGHILVDRELYLPKSWKDDQQRCQEAHVPEEVAFATKPELAWRILERTQVTGLPVTWVTGDTVYESSQPLQGALEERRQAFALAVTCKEQEQEFNRIVLDFLSVL